MLNRGRRGFLAGAGLLLLDGRTATARLSANERIAFACIGIDGKGRSDTADAARHGDIVAICDADRNRLEAAGKLYPSARKFTDYRRLFEEMSDSIDAVTVSTPDHNHFPAAALALRQGKHVFCQKPLTHTIWEARQLGQLALAGKLATQMGNQGTAGSGLRKSAALIRAGLLGAVKEVHVWTNRPVWPQGGPRPEPDILPPHLDWDAWLGPAMQRPYDEKAYHPFAWRGWWDFGTGALGDMACHTVNMPFMALDLRDPVSVAAETSGHNGDSYPTWSQIVFEFPRRGLRGPVRMVWYDGGKKAPAELLEGRKVSDSGCLVVGERGKLYSPGDYGSDRVLIGVQESDVSFPESPGHFEEWVRAIRGGEPAMSNFPHYASPLTETILLGNLAVWASGKKIEWDSYALNPVNAPEVAQVVNKEYRSGWKVW